MSNSSADTRPRLFKYCSKGGFVTQLAEVTEQEPQQIADRLGLSRHLMADGYALLLLIGSVARQDFAWHATTQFSGGWVKERIYYKDKNRMRSSVEYVRVADQTRFAAYQGDGYEHEVTWDAFISEQETLLQTRNGCKRIVKIVPFLKGGPGDYPNVKRNAAAQWELLVPKEFYCAKIVTNRGIIRAGEFDATHAG
ncbi:hypothetical protein OU994_17015 [Pseudoduganella sp. SL102]|uniref:hypothetical protein n=1 Tax=Pseudoduganella sp. SL102 TaxID=2995154 RepID=UPI00248C2AD8|nr:hypothetical protein [Pseudoduganella sp. SL102]WBS00025.1 hypothetical protein OU994_17015 [Pseudoduganella sp. SL102]